MKRPNKQYRLVRNNVVTGYYNTGAYPLRLAKHWQNKGEAVRIEFRTVTAARAEEKAWFPVWPLFVGVSPYAA